MVSQRITLPDICNRFTDKVYEICQPSWSFNCLLETIANILLKGRAEHFSFTYYNDYSDDLSSDLTLIACRETPTLPNGWEEVRDLKMYANKLFPSKFHFFKNEDETKFLVVSRGSLLWQHYHLICSLFPRLCPRYFAVDPLTEKEAELLASLNEDTKIHTEKWLNEYYSTTEWQKMLNDEIANKINEAICKASEKEAIQNAESAKRNLERAEREYISWLERSKEAEIRLIGVKASMKDNDKSDEIRGYLTNNKNIQIIDYNSNGFSLIAKGYLTNVDPDIFEEYIRNKNSYLHERPQRCNPEWLEDRRVKFLNALFSNDPKFKIRIAAKYTIDARGVGVNSGMEVSSYYAGYRNYLTNPHIYNFACLGNYKPLMNRAILDGDVVGAMDLCVASVTSMNITESVTVENFFKQLFSTDRKCIEDFDGNEYSPLEAIKKLESEESNNGESNQV